MDLVYKNEKPLFAIAAILSALFWLLLVLGTIGIVIVYLLFGYVFFLFAHSAFISYLRGTGVRITPQQYPDLHERLVRACERVGLKEVPEAYLLRTDFFNALATRFLGRHFLVLFTDVVDALEERPGAIDFYIGHELGHIHRNHLLWKGFVMPASILPLLGTALRRAEEYTCDRYGVACCQEEADVRAALAAIAAGNSRWSSLNVGSYVEQVKETSGFWMSFNELTGDYPWLTKRMATAVALKEGREVRHPRRHLFAWILALFIPRFGAGGAASLVVTIALVGVLAAIAVPAYVEFQQRASIQSAYSTAQEVQQKTTAYYLEHQEMPADLAALGYADGALSNPVLGFDVDIYEEGIIAAQVGTDAAGDPEYIVLEPSVTDSGLGWTCYGQNLETERLPVECR